MVKEPEPLYFAEDPLEDENEDDFHHSGITDVLQYVILRSSGSINIALYGGWGVGKSTIINFLKNRINSKKELENYQLIIIDAWKLSPEILRQELLEEMAKALGIKESKIQKYRDDLYHIKEVIEDSPSSSGDKIKNIFFNRLVPVYAFIAIFIGLNEWGKYVKEDYLASSLIGSIIVPLVIFGMQYYSEARKTIEKATRRIIPKAESSQQFEKIFKDIIDKKQKSKLIIAVDNLDRCDEKSAVKILGSIKTFMGDKNCIYIIPCDETALVNHLKKEFGYGYEKLAKEFLRKFFQIVVNVPPQIKGDLDTYVTKQIEKFSEFPFEEDVKEVLITGTGRNPRKLRQYLYNLTILFKLAEIREGDKVRTLTPGIITDHSGYLAKIIVIQEEWPQIFDQIQHNETLLKTWEQHQAGIFEGDPEDYAIIEGFFQDNPEFFDFLRATSLVTVDDVRPFIRLSQESFESTTSDSQILKKYARENNVKKVLEHFKSQKPEQIDKQAEILLEQAENFVSHKNNQPAFNVTNIILEIYELVSKPLKLKIILELSKNLVSLPKLKSSLHMFDLNKLFPILLKMPEPSKSTLLKECAIDLLLFSPVNPEIVNQFIQHSDELPVEVTDEFDKQVSRLGGSKLEKFTESLETISKNENATKILIKNQTMNELVGRIDTSQTQANKLLIELFIKLKNKTTFVQKKKFVQKMFEIVNKEGGNVLNETSKGAIHNIYRFVESDVDEKTAKVIAEEIKAILPKYVQIQDKNTLFLLILRIISKVPEQTQKELLMAINFESIISNPAQLLELLKVTTEKGTNILSVDILLEKIISKFIQYPIHENNLIPVLSGIPEDKFEKVIPPLIIKINSLDQNVIVHPINALGKLKGKIPESVFDDLFLAILNRLKVFQPAENHPRLLELVDVIADGKEIPESFFELISEWTKEGNADKLTRGIQLVTKSFPKLSSKQKKKIIEDMLSNLTEQLKHNRQNQEKLLLDALISLKDEMSQDKITELVDILNSQIIPNKPVPIIKDIFNSLQNIELGSKYSEVELSILNLNKKTPDQAIKNLCQTACDKFGMKKIVQMNPFYQSGGKEEDGQMSKNLCVEFRVNRTQNTDLFMEYEVPENAPKPQPPIQTDVKVYVKQNDKEIHVSDWLGYEGRESELPLSTGIFALEDEEGKISLRVCPEGREIGSNTGYLDKWQGTVYIYQKNR